MACEVEIEVTSVFFVFVIIDLVRKELVVTNGEAIVAALKETLRYGLFLGTFAGTFVSMDELIGALGGHRRHVLFFSCAFFVSFAKCT